MDILTLLIIVLIIAALMSYPVWPYNRAWGWSPFSILTLVLIVVLLLVLFGGGHGHLTFCK